MSTTKERSAPRRIADARRASLRKGDERNLLAGREGYPIPGSEWSKRKSRDRVYGMGERVRMLRVARGWTQVHLAAKAGTSPDKIVAVERDRHRGGFSFRKAIDLANALDTSLDYLAGITADPTPRR